MAYLFTLGQMEKPDNPVTKRMLIKNPRHQNKETKGPGKISAQTNQGTPEKLGNWDKNGPEEEPSEELNTKAES